MEESTSIAAKCVFCFSTQFELPSEDYVPSSGEMIRCANCGRLNDLDSVMRVVKRKGIDWTEAQAEKLIAKELKKMEKLFK